MSGMSESSLLTRGLIDERRYTESLLNTAERLGLIGSSFRTRFFHSFQTLLLRQCRAYCGSTSDSMSRGTAEQIAESIFFTLSVHLSRFEPLDALAMLENGSLEQCYQEGRQQVNRLIQASELAWRSELRRPIPAENVLLCSTLRDGIAGFFKLYNPEYGAHEIHITADYPVLFYPQGWKGVEFIRLYLDNIITENRFLRLFETAPLHRCLNLYALKSGTHLSELYSNMFEIVLACSLRPFLPDGPVRNQLPAAAYRLMDRLECHSSAIREYVIRACVENGTDLLRIQHFMSEQ